MSHMARLKCEINEAGELVIDTYSLVELLPGEMALRLADAVSLHPAVIQAVTDQILGGYTDMDSFAARVFGEADPVTPLEKAIRRVALNSRSTAGYELEAMAKNLRRAETELKAIDEWRQKNLTRAQSDSFDDARQAARKAVQ